MTDELFKLLEKRNITSGPAAFEVISEYSYDQMMILAADCFMAIKDVGGQSQSKLFSFAPIKSIAGGDYPCSSVECRLESAYSFSLLASLYADKVILPNFFDYMFYILNEESSAPETDQEIADFEYRLCADIAVCFQFKPLFDAGIAYMNFTIPTVCKNCHARHKKESKEFSDKLDVAIKKTRAKFDSKVRFVYLDDHYIEVQNDDDYLGGKQGYAIRNTLKAAMRKHIPNIPYILKEAEVNRFGLRDFQIDICVDDILEYDFYPSLNSSTYLTNRQFDVDLIESAKPGSNYPLMTGHVPAFHSLPYLQDIHLEDLIKIRVKEEISFKVYRDTVNKIVESKNPEVAKKYAADELTPALNKISNIISQHQKHYQGRAGKKIAMRSVIAVAGLGAANLLNIPVQISASVIGTAGMFSSQDIVDDMKAGKEIPIDAKVDPYYFMWAIQQQHAQSHLED